jgi:hypothetical protein
MCTHIQQSAFTTLRTLERAIASAITAKLKPATELITALLGSDCSGARGQLLRELLILPGGQQHPLFLPEGDERRQVCMCTHATAYACVILFYFIYIITSLR